MNKNIYQWLDEYGKSHQNSINKKIHWICVPLIMLSLIGLLSSIPHGFTIVINNTSFFLNWAIIFLFFVSIYYFLLSKKLFIGMILVSIMLIYGVELLLLFNYALWKTSLIIFIFAWIGQFVGHEIEGMKPSFLKDLQFLLIGPAWLLSFIYKKLNIPI